MNQARVSRYLQANIRQLRESRGLTQDRLARMSGVPRATWANLESGTANPTIAVLVRVASVLQVPIEELVGAPRSECEFFDAASIPSKRRGDVLVRKLLPESLRGVELDRIELAPGARMGGVPHRSGAREYLTCESGRIELTVSERVFELKPGDVVVFRGDQRHAYRNPGDRTAVGYSVILIGQS